MTDDPIAVLERELVDAARRRARQRPRDRRWMSVGTLATVALSAVTLAVAGEALILLGGHQRPVTRAPAAADTSKQQLIDIIGALRRPQTKADLSLSILSSLQKRLFPLQGEPDLPLVRFATTTSWGEKLYFVPMKPPTAQQLVSFAHRFHSPAKVIVSLRVRGETLSTFSSQGGGGGGGAALIEAGKSIATDGAGRSFAGGSSQTRFVLVVPDGVARVEFVLPRQPQPGVPGTPIYSRSSTVTAAAQHNIVAVQVDREFDGGSPPMIWYSPGGQVLKRIGNFDRVNRVTTPPRPAPETPLSRAAEGDPSSPNRVWVTPVLGGPHTNFMLHFRLLLTDADYGYQLNGTRCPAITVNGGDGGGGSLGLRGRIWSDVLDAVSGQTWCPGTYHLSATVMDLGRYGALKRPAKAFGTATFTVRP